MSVCPRCGAAGEVVGTAGTILFTCRTVKTNDDVTVMSDTCTSHSWLAATLKLQSIIALCKPLESASELAATVLKIARDE